MLEQNLADVIRTVMRPMVRLLIRRGVAFGEFANIVRRLYVEVADGEFQLAGRKQSVSRIAILTGITRREVARILAEPDLRQLGGTACTRPVRVVTGWLRDREFLSDSHQPRLLPVKSDDELSFTDLVKRYGGDVPVRAMLDEMLRIGVVLLDSDDRVALVSTGYVPGRDSTALLQAASRSIADLISTIDRNDQQSSPEDTYLQLTVNYDNLGRDGANAFRLISREKSKELLVYLDSFLAERNGDLNPDIDAEGPVRSGIGIFYFQDEFEAPSPDARGSTDRT